MKFANALWLIVVGLTILTYCTVCKDCGFIELCIVTFIIIMFKDYREQLKRTGVKNAI